MIRYDQDVYGWSVETAAALRERRFDEVDWDSVAEEILSVGKSEAHRLQSSLMQLLLQMLKRKYQPDKYGKSWELSIKEHRERVEILLEDNPSLRPRRESIVRAAYRIARIRAARQTGIDLHAFPETCEWTAGEVMGE